ncbi:hypothetical protein [Leuconostoc citreum]|uniref:hypothetical protein n=1 Tax=Leuconostoc citreum TaxID=33964 RepID=UPI000C288492|nr:hypothetical protein [Leuconostoc citreum]
MHYVFGGLSKHQVNLEAYQKQLGNETQNIISDIAQKFISQIFGGNSLSTKGLVLVNIILLVAWGIIRFGLKKKVAIVKVAMLLNTITFFYYLSLFIMYIVSMPYSEAIQIAGFERYMSSIIVFDLLISAITLSIIIDKTFYEQSIEKRDFHAFHSIMSKNIYQVSSLLLLLFSIIFMFSEINGTKYSNRMSVNTLPDQLKRIAKEEYTFNQKKILIVDPHKENISDQYTSVVGRYYFFNDTVIGRENFMMSSSDFYRTIQGYDYVVIPEWHRTFTVMVAKVYHQSIKTGMYKIEKSGLVKTNMIILK